MKQIISIVPLWAIGLSTILFGSFAHADEFNPAIEELRAWNCRLTENFDCNVPAKSEASTLGATKFFRVRIEQDEQDKFFMRDPNADQRYFFSHELAIKSPKVVQDIITNCQFRTKDSYCTIEATLNIDRFESVASWSLHRYQIAE